VVALGQELAQPLGRQRDRVRARDANRVKTELARDMGERRLERGCFAQKSRSA
jgi:hypothetical protein